MVLLSAPDLAAFLSALLDRCCCPPLVTSDVLALYYDHTAALIRFPELALLTVAEAAAFSAPKTVTSRRGCAARMAAADTAMPCIPTPSTSSSTAPVDRTDKSSTPTTAPSNAIIVAQGEVGNDADTPSPLHTYGRNCCDSKSGDGNHTNGQERSTRSQPLDFSHLPAKERPFLFAGIDAVLDGPLDIVDLALGRGVLLPRTVTINRCDVALTTDNDTNEESTKVLVAKLLQTTPTCEDTAVARSSKFGNVEYYRRLSNDLTTPGATSADMTRWTLAHQIWRLHESPDPTPGEPAPLPAHRGGGGPALDSTVVSDTFRLLTTFFPGICTSSVMTVASPTTASSVVTGLVRHLGHAAHGSSQSHAKKAGDPTQLHNSGVSSSNQCDPTVPFWLAHQNARLRDLTLDDIADWATSGAAAALVTRRESAMALAEAQAVRALLRDEHEHSDRGDCPSNASSVRALKERLMTWLFDSSLPGGEARRVFRAARKNGDEDEVSARRKEVPAQQTRVVFERNEEAKRFSMLEQVRARVHESSNDVGQNAQDAASSLAPVTREQSSKLASPWTTVRESTLAWNARIARNQNRILCVRLNGTASSLGEQLLTGRVAHIDLRGLPLLRQTSGNHGSGFRHSARVTFAPLSIAPVPNLHAFFETAMRDLHLPTLCPNASRIFQSMFDEAEEQAPHRPTNAAPMPSAAAAVQRQRILTALSSWRSQHHINVTTTDQNGGKSGNATTKKNGGATCKSPLAVLAGLDAPTCTASPSSLLTQVQSRCLYCPLHQCLLDDCCSPLFEQLHLQAEQHERAQAKKRVREESSQRAQYSQGLSRHLDVRLTDEDSASFDEEETSTATTAINGANTNAIATPSVLSPGVWSSLSLPLLTSLGPSTASFSALRVLDISNVTTLESIGAYTFRGSPVLEHVDASGCVALRRLGQCAFMDCKALEEVRLDHCFMQLTNTQSISQRLVMQLCGLPCPEKAPAPSVNNDEAKKAQQPEGVSIKKTPCCAPRSCSADPNRYADLTVRSDTASRYSFTVRSTLVIGNNDSENENNERLIGGPVGESLPDSFSSVERFGHCFTSMLCWPNLLSAKEEAWAASQPQRANSSSINGHGPANVTTTGALNGAKSAPSTTTTTTTATAGALPELPLGDRREFSHRCAFVVARGAAESLGTTDDPFEGCDMLERVVVPRPVALYLLRPDVSQRILSDVSAGTLCCPEDIAVEEVRVRQSIIDASREKNTAAAAMAGSEPSAAPPVVVRRRDRATREAEGEKRCVVM